MSQRKDLVRYTKIEQDIKPLLFTWDNSFFDLTKKVEPYDATYYSFVKQGEIEIKPVSDAFDGQLYLLVNAANSSATFYFAEIAKNNKLATLVGETTGGSQQGLNAGSMFFLRLPNSKIEIDIPIIGTFSKDKPLGGTVPDIPIVETVEDIINQQDKVLLKVNQMTAN